MYVKRIVKDGPADQCKRIQPGDVLQLIDGEDIYGQGLDVLRNKIPGPAGSMVKLGFRSFAGQLYEVDLQRNAYGDNNQTAQPMVQPQYVSAQRTVMVHPGTQVVQVSSVVLFRGFVPLRLSRCDTHSRTPDSPLD